MLVHRGQVAVDPKARVIVAVQAETATGSEADALSTLIGRARFAGHAVAELGADAGYASQHSYAQLEQIKTTALIPPQPGAKHSAAVAAPERMRTPAGRDTAIDRQTHAEGAIAELKHHGLGRARCRGTQAAIAAARRGHRDQPQASPGRPERPREQPDRRPGRAPRPSGRHPRPVHRPRPAARRDRPPRRGRKFNGS
ncbi:MAG: hypothetical protein M3P44_00045 [Actinomycetota bacterium]|nr:hypothetical protein [Actinomycetota bacterium]